MTTRPITELAALIECITEDELMLLGGYTRGSVDSLRRRGLLPAHSRFGNHNYYPLHSVRDFLASRLKSKLTDETT